MCTTWSSWGDSISNWLGPYTSGETVSLKHTWNFVGDYSINVKAKDSEGLESGWSEASLSQHCCVTPH